MVLSLASTPGRWHYRAETCRSKVIVMTYIVSALIWHIKRQYWFKMHGVNHFEIGKT